MAHIVCQATVTIYQLTPLHCEGDTFRGSNVFTQTLTLLMNVYS